eukprot:TRINITY_DN9711_c0_g1_i2.p1 TRINITY_DN9711_c0_g1~~TRINITY_DN9711_c0_g1_i2.p1  ORF type:complete len:170 (+),score=10.71 TRINITY_DN9711_c0_g1_i2:287-796(+)
MLHQPLCGHHPFLQGLRLNHAHAIGLVLLVHPAIVRVGLDDVHIPQVHRVQVRLNQHLEGLHRPPEGRSRVRSEVDQTQFPFGGIRAVPAGKRNLLLAVESMDLAIRCVIPQADVSITLGEAGEDVLWVALCSLLHDQSDPGAGLVIAPFPEPGRFFHPKETAIPRTLR